MSLRLAAILFVAFLAGCAGPGGGLRMNTDHTAQGQDSRVQYIILHYTAGDSARSLKTLTEKQVSSHYLVDVDGTIYRLVDENRRAWHAGDSAWKGAGSLNAASIGIELVNKGFQEGANGRAWYPYPDRQIDALIELLKDIQTRHDVDPDQILGHSDVAPQRKLDPGPLFPWHKLAAAGLVNTPPRALIEHRLNQLQGQVPPAFWFQEELRRLGYTIDSTGEFDRATINVIAAFQMRHRPARADGQPDLETAAWIMSLPAPR